MRYLTERGMQGLRLLRFASALWHAPALVYHSHHQPAQLFGNHRVVALAETLGIANFNTDVLSLLHLQPSHDERQMAQEHV